MMIDIPCSSIHRSGSTTDLAGARSSDDAYVDLEQLSLDDLAKMLEERKSLLASVSSGCLAFKCSPPSSPSTIKTGSPPRTSLSFDSGCETGVDSTLAAMLYQKQTPSTPSGSERIDDGTPRKLTPEERAAKIERYRAKRQARNFQHRISYQCRKKVADKRPRVRGRFARDDEAGAVYPEEAAKAPKARGRKRSKADIEAENEAALLASVLI